MKISLNHIKFYRDKYNWSDEPAPNGIEDLVEKIGAQLGGIDEVIDLGKKYKGIVIAKVVSCEKHPNADKLKVCKIDDGGVAKDVPRDENGHVQVVCGAQNVDTGMLIAWLPPGATVPATYDKDPLVLEAREIRGQMSSGMIASPSELAISDDHAGILEITEDDVKPGDDFSETFELDDYIIDIENKMFTHRPDLFGMLGIAREIAGIQQKPFKSPFWYVPAPEFPAIEVEELKLEVKNELPDLVPRFSAITMSGIKVGPSPLWLQILLSKLGMKSINNIVDYTNYYMYLTAQPLHAYDYDKVKAHSNGDAAIVVRHANEGEKIKLLNGKEIKPRREAIMIATDKKLIGIGGVMGGGNTEVDENTTNIIIESANFDMYSIRRTAMEHGLFTDAVTRFTKGQSPLQNAAVIAKITNTIQTEGGKVASAFIDDNHLPEDVRERGTMHPLVQVSAEFINSRLGLKMSAEEMAQVLANVEFVTEITRGSVLVIKPPFWRTDIEIPEDIVEEVGRLYGYDHLPLDLPKRNIVPVGPDELLQLKAEVRTKLAVLGANEVLTYSFVHGNLLDKTGQDKELAFKITNALSPDLQYYRLSLTPSLLDKVHMNTKAGYDEFVLFEIGKAHVKSELDDAGLPREFERLAFVYGGSEKTQRSDAAFYLAKEYLSQLASHEVIPFDASLLNDYKPLQQMMVPYDESRSGLIWNDKMPVGIVGEFKADIARKLKLPAHTAGFEIFISALRGSDGRQYHPLSRFPVTSQDITLKVSTDHDYAQVSSELVAQVEAVAPKDVRVTVEPLGIFQTDAEARTKNLTFRVVAVSYERTLLTENLSEMLDRAAKNLAVSLGAERS